MQLLSEIVQGSESWHELRARHFCASEAPIIMGVSRHTKRTEFLALKATGQSREFSDWVKRNLLEKGHEAEAKARPVVEQLVGEEFYPSVGISDCGKYLASFDGLTVDESTALELKLWNADLVEQIRQKQPAEEYAFQMEHQCLVGNLERVIFVCSDGTEERTVWMEYRPDPARRAKLIAGWAQFEEDLKNYQHVEVLPAPAATAITALPALSVQIVGEVRSSNLPAFQDAASRAIAAINTDLQTDQDFADAEAAIKWCDTGEKDLATVKRLAVGQMTSIDELFRTVDALSEQMRSKRLELEKLVTARKNTIREEIRQEGVKTYAAHIASLNERLGKPYMPNSSVDFAAAMKGKRTIASLREAVNKALLDGRLEANKVADGIAINLRVLDASAEHRFLFNDEATLVQMDAAGFSAVVENRILKHKQEQQRKEEEARERIRREEEAKAQRDAAALAEKERERIRAEEQAKAIEEAKKNLPPAPPQTAYSAPATVKVSTQQRTAQSAPATRPAPPLDEILMLIFDRYSVPKSLAAKWLHELFSKEPA